MTDTWVIFKDTFFLVNYASFCIIIFFLCVLAILCLQKKFWIFSIQKVYYISRIKQSKVIWCASLLFSEQTQCAWHNAMHINLRLTATHYFSQGKIKMVLGTTNVSEQNSTKGAWPECYMICYTIWNAIACTCSAEYCMRIF